MSHLWKAIIGGALLAATGSARASDILDTSITASSVVRLDVDQPEVDLWVSYPGRISRVCGIKIKATSGMIDAQALLDGLDFGGRPFVAGTSSVVEATLWSGATTIGYGEMVGIKTKSGKNLDDFFESVIQQKSSDPAAEPTLVVAEALGC